MSRLIRRGASLLGVALFLVAVPLASYLAWVATRAPALAAGPVTDLQVALMRAGLDAEALAAAGVTAQETSSLVSAFSSAMAAQPGRLAQADASLAAARVAADALQRKIASGLASANEVAAYSGAKTELATAEAERADTLDDWFTAATSGLLALKTATLSKLRANRHWELPLEFLVKDRDQAEWVAVRKALANERIAPKYGDAPDLEQQAALATWRADPACAAAKASSGATLAAVKSAWNSSTGG